MQDKLKELYTQEYGKLPEIPWNEYPRPKLKRDSFFCLNGEWDFCECESQSIPKCFDEKIIVPFCPQSAISGIHRNIPDSHYIFYRKTFTLPENFIKDIVILHFGAVDQYTDVYLNGSLITSHKGGYEHFSADITDYLSYENELIVSVFDKLDTKILPYGKQKHNRGGMWYTPVTGIWQTVWIESVPKEYVKNISVNIKENLINFYIDGIEKGEIILPSENKRFVINDGIAQLELENLILWSPENPHIYEFEVISKEDKVNSYFTARSLKIENSDCFARILLNNKPYFFNGLLDQGYWPDGIFTPTSPEMFKKDILFAKKLGYNTLRKHIKIEPDLFYYYCDKLGVIVFQDMVNNGEYNFFRDTALPTIGVLRKNDKKMHIDEATRKAFNENMYSTVNQLKEFGCICYWTIFNEGWGQFNSTEAYENLKNIDATRIIDSASGWFKGGKSDVESLHIYFKKLKIKKSKMPIILSEFGGYSYKIDDHVFNPLKDYGYGKCNSKEEYHNKLVKLYEDDVIPLIKQGLCGAIFTQISDVEDEINGLITYDRKVEKIDSALFKKLFDKIKI